MFDLSPYSGTSIIYKDGIHFFLHLGIFQILKNLSYLSSSRKKVAKKRKFRLKKDKCGRPRALGLMQVLVRAMHVVVFL